MLLPASYASALLLMVLTMICLGSWANTQKLAGKWRYELYYLDFAAGLLLAAVLAGLTLGSLGYDGFSLMDDLAKAGKREEFYGAVGGAVFSLGNILLVAAISVSGLTVAMPIALGVALIFSAGWAYALEPAGSLALLIIGAVLVAAAVVFGAMADRHYQLQKSEAAAKAGVGSTRMKVSSKALILSLISGVVLGSFPPIVHLSVYRENGGENGLGPYSLALVFAGGAFLATFVYDLFLMNLPVEGPPVPVWDYFRGTVKQHILGIAGGTIFMAGTIASFVAATTVGSARLGPIESYALGYSAPLVAAMWGLLFWKEYAGADSRTRILIALMFVVFGSGLGMIASSNLFAG